MNCFINLLYFGMMANFTVVPNTTATCNSQTGCINKMCQLSKNVDFVCFNTSGEFDYGGDFITSMLLSIIFALTIYSVFITFVTLYWKKD
jgi:hypothetical protein